MLSIIQRRGVRVSDFSSSVNFEFLGRWRHIFKALTERHSREASVSDSTSFAQRFSEKQSHGCCISTEDSMNCRYSRNVPHCLSSCRKPVFPNIIIYMVAPNTQVDIILWYPEAAERSTSPKSPGEIQAQSRCRSAGRSSPPTTTFESFRVDGKSAFIPFVIGIQRTLVLPTGWAKRRKLFSGGILPS